VAVPSLNLAGQKKALTRIFAGIVIAIGHYVVARSVVF
jgi:hypothetical protein